MITLAQRPQPGTNRCHLTWAFMFGLSTLLATPPTQAQIAHDFRLLPDPQRTISSQRAYFVYEAAAGRVIEDAVLVRNVSERSLRLSLFSADAVTASRGGLAVGTRMNDTPERAGAWVDITQSELILAPTEDRSVPFTLKLPSDLPPGEYAASIVAQQAEEGEEQQAGPMGVRFVPRFAATVLITVPGASADALLPQLEITDLKAPPDSRQQTVIADLSNTGNDGLQEARGSLTVHEPDGPLVREMPVRLGYFLARDDLDYRIGLEQELAAGEYDVTLSLTHKRGTVELTRRLYLGELPKLPVVRHETVSKLPVGPPRLPQWVFMAIGTAAISIALLLALLAVQSRRLAKARLEA